MQRTDGVSFVNPYRCCMLRGTNMSGLPVPVAQTEIFHPRAHGMNASRSAISIPSNPAMIAEYVVMSS